MVYDAEKVIESVKNTTFYVSTAKSYKNSNIKQYHVIFA